MMIRSVYVEAQKDEAFKWIESQKPATIYATSPLRALGPGEHWWGFLRERWIQHLQGTAYWMELDRGDFGPFNNAFLDKQELLHPILNRLKGGLENLDVIPRPTRRSSDGRRDRHPRSPRHQQPPTLASVRRLTPSRSPPKSYHPERTHLAASGGVECRVSTSHR
ncbi:MAG: hypothetical protein U0744_05555 [Gemmataceae bacterium]